MEGRRFSETSTNILSDNSDASTVHLQIHGCISLTSINKHCKHIMDEFGRQEGRHQMSREGET